MLDRLVGPVIRRSKAYELLGRSGLRRGVVILMYHRVGGPRAPWLFPTVDPQAFDQQMAYIRRHYDVLSLEEALSYLQGRDARPRRGVVVTFDDGYADNHWYAMPILRKHRIPATVFLATDYMSRPRLFWWDRLAYAAYHAPGRSGDPEVLRGRLLDAACRLSPWSETAVDEMVAELGAQVPDELGHQLVLTWQQVAEMSRAGIAFGGHTHTHPWLAGIPSADRWHEIRLGREVLLSHVPSTFVPFAYPNGFFDAELESMCARAGFHCALTCEAPAPHLTQSVYRLGRTAVAADLRGLQLQVAGVPDGIPGWLRQSPRVCRTVWRPLATAQQP